MTRQQARPAMTDRPDLSVVIPAYNAERTLARAIDSVLAQTVQCAQIVVCDDGSTDGTAEVMRRYEGRIVAVSQPNRGRGAARNRALAHATGRLIAFLDADDWWVPAKLEIQLAAVDAHPERDVFFGNMYVVDANGTIYQTMNGQWHVGHSGSVFGYLIRNNFVPFPTVLVRREALEAAGPFDETLPRCQDLELLLRLAARGQFHYSNTILGYCDNGNWGTAEKRRVTYEMFLRLLDKAGRLFPDLMREHAHHVAKSYSDSHCELAGCCEEAHDFRQAARHYTDALTHTPRSRVVQWKRALALYRAGEADCARQAIEQYLAHDPHHVEGRFYLGTLHLSGGELSPARQELENALYGGYLYQHFPECLNNLGVAYARLGGHDRARELFEQAVQQQACYSDALKNLDVVSRPQNGGGGDLRVTPRKVF